MLDLEAFTYLTRALESSISPIVILASNRGLTPIRGAADTLPPSAHGIPPDLLARLLIVPTHPYAPAEIAQIVRLRGRAEGLRVADAAYDKAADAGVRVSLRYALQLLTPASILARVAGRDEVAAEDVGRVLGLVLGCGEECEGVGGGWHGVNCRLDGRSGRWVV